MNAIDFYIIWSFFGAVIPPRFQAMWTLFLLHLVSFLWYQPAPCLQQLYPSFFSPALSHPLHYSSPPPPAPVPSVYPLRHYPPPLPSPPSSNLPMRYSRDQLLEIQPSTPNFELVNRLRELRLGVGLPRKRGCRGGRKKLRSIQVVPSRNLHPLMVPPFLQPHPDLQSAVGNAPLSSKHPTHLPTTDCLLSITPLMGGQPSDAPALSPPSPLQQGGQSSNAPALLPPSPLPQGSQPIALALSPSSPLPQDGQPSDAPGLSPSSSTLLLCPSDSTLSICHLNSQSAVKTVDIVKQVFKEADIEVTDEMIDRSHRVGKKLSEGDAKSRPILVKCTSYRYKSMLMTAKKKLPAVDVKKLFPNADWPALPHSSQSSRSRPGGPAAVVPRVYINHDLTRERAEIAWMVRYFKRQRKIDDTWVYDGVIFVRQGESTYRVATKREMRVFGVD
ncbi:hypothetical protein ACOMHN_058811 [Nucella lapillus]